MNIPVTEARNVFTKTLIDVYKERIEVPSFIRSFFASKEYSTKYISLEVQRGGEKVAADVLRGADPNMNTFSKSTEKVYEPPFYYEEFRLNELDVYDMALGATNTSTGYMSQFIDTAADKLLELRKKIERAYELQCAQAFTSGIVTVNNGDNIDYRRKAGSLVDLGSTTGYWTVSGKDIFADLQDACVFIRKSGKVFTHEFDAILGEDAADEMFKNSVFLSRQNLFNMKLDSIAAPQKNSTGGVYHGSLTCGSYRVNIWTYPQFYEASNGTMTPYIDPKKVIVVPSQNSGLYEVSFAAVPQIIKPGQAPVKGAYMINEFMDERKANHSMSIKSAGLGVLKAVDTVYTMKIKA
jgi:hypothetical protein